MVVRKGVCVGVAAVDERESELSEIGEGFCYIYFYATFIELGMSLKNKFFFTMTAYTSQTQTLLGQLCATPMGLPITSGCDTAWI